jgi:hypothetical protein
MYCYECGQERVRGQKFCPNCGTRFKATKTGVHSDSHRIRGWLLTLVVFIWLAIGYSIYQLVVLAMNAQQITVDITLPVIALVLRVLVGLVAFGLIATYRKAAIYTTLAWLALGVLVTVSGALAVGIQYADPLTFITIMASFVAALGWGLYLFMSERVQRTLTE